jgi:hypothetical protein
MFRNHAFQHLFLFVSFINTLFNHNNTIEEMKNIAWFWQYCDDPAISGFDCAWDSSDGHAKVIRGESGNIAKMWTVPG